MLELLLMLLSAAMPPNYPASPVVHQDIIGDAVMSLHDDGAVSLVSAVKGERVIICSVADGAAPPEGSGPPQDPIPQITSTWTSAGGVHSVSTPVPSPTPGGLQKAVAQHQQLVTMMQAIYPPVPQ